MSHYYTLNDFNKIQMDGFSYNLDKSILDIIINISKLVGDDGYIKTPNFERKKNQYRKKKKQIQDNEWKIMRDFKVTAIEKKEGIEQHINQIRGYINKMSDRTYDKEFNNILNIIQDNNIDKNETNMNRVIDSLYTTITSNNFNSQLYAVLYKDLLEKFPCMQIKLNNELYKLEKYPEEINYCDPNTDYDTFCINNKENDKKKSTILLFTYMMINNTISVEKMFKLLEIYVNSILETNINNAEKKNTNEQIVEWIYIIIKNGYELLVDDLDWDDMYNNIETTSNYKSKDYDGLTNKIIFKFMDIVEYVEENE